MTGGFADLDDDEDSPKKKRRKITVRTVKPTVDARFRGVDASSIKQVGVSSRFGCLKEQFIGHWADSFEIQHSFHMEHTGIFTLRCTD